MNQPTVSEILAYARFAQSLARRALLRGGVMVHKKDRDLPLLLYTERKTVEWLYDQDADSIDTRIAANYLLSLCGEYGLAARSASSGQSGVVSSGTVVSASSFPIHITQADFEPSDGVSYNDARIAGKNLGLLMNDLNQRMIYSGTGFSYTATGFVMKTDAAADIPGFDARLNNYDILIYQIFT